MLIQCASLVSGTLSDSMRRCAATLVLLFSPNPLFSGTPLIKSTDGGRTWIDIDPGQYR